MKSKRNRLTICCAHIGKVYPKKCGACQLCPYFWLLLWRPAGINQHLTVCVGFNFSGKGFDLEIILNLIRSVNEKFIERGNPFAVKSCPFCPGWKVVGFRNSDCLVQYKASFLYHLLPFLFRVGLYVRRVAHLLHFLVPLSNLRIIGQHCVYDGNSTATTQDAMEFIQCPCDIRKMMWSDTAGQ